MAEDMPASEQLIWALSFLPQAARTLPMTAQWCGICENLRKSLDSGAFKVWIAPLHGEVKDHILKLTAPSAYVAQRVRERLGDQVLAAASQELGLPVEALELRVLVAEGAGEALVRPATVATESAVQATAIPAVSTASPVSPVPVAPLAGDTMQAVSSSAVFSSSAYSLRPAISQSALPIPPMAIPSVRWRYGFDDFVVGPTNAVAVAAAQDLCRRNGAVETLFVSADSGLGKTHLTHAIGQALFRERGEARVGYLTAEDFTTRFVLASRTHQMDAFKAALRELDVLLLDDVHFFQGKEKTQDEALATIKSLQARGSRVVMTSSFTPRELHNVDSQLVSYFCSGLLANMDKPTEDMRRSMLIRKASVHQVLLPDSVTDLLASHLSNDVRQLESCLNNLIFKARHLNRRICVELAMDVLAQYAQVEQRLDVESIIRLVCESYGLSERQLSSRSRRHECVLARNTIYYLARKHTDVSLQEIGEKFNRRHTTVIKGITSIERELQRESAVGRQVANAVQLIERNGGRSAVGRA